MKILIVHNYYLQSGGEDLVVHAESELLRMHGNSVVEFFSHNKYAKGFDLIIGAMNTIWSFSKQKEIKSILISFKPDIVHFHNTFTQISPAAYYTCQNADIPVVQTMHNYRFLCPAATFTRNGRVCELCIGKIAPWPGILYGCWRNSRLATSLVVIMLTVHNLLKTWQYKIDKFIALSQFARNKLISGGLPSEKIVVKPNFLLINPDIGDHLGNYALFVGRISVEKGITTLIKAWESNVHLTLKIVGDGPLYKNIRIKKIGQDCLVWYGQQPHDHVITLIQKATFLIYPSECYETFGLTIIEAFACGTPVIASRLGAMAEIVEDGKTGLLFTPEDAEDLAAKVQWAWDHPKEMAEMGINARREYEEKYTAEKNYQMLMDIYQMAIENHKRR